VTSFRKSIDWMSEIKCEVIQNQMDNLDKAYKSFFRGSGYPKFKKKSNNQSFLSKQNFKILENSNKIVFYGNKIKFKCSEENSNEIRISKIKTVTYSKDCCGMYYASILIEFNPVVLEKTTKSIGVDLGLKSFLVSSDNLIIENPKFLKRSQIKLIREQKRLSRKTKGSNNRNKQRIKLAKVHNKISNQRNHFLHQISNKLINENQVIYMENLNVKGMLSNHNLSKSISDSS
jgi:putative transposase